MQLESELRDKVSNAVENLGYRVRFTPNHHPFAMQYAGDLPLMVSRQSLVHDSCRSRSATWPRKPA
jgi:hypothetical protein